MTIQRKYSLPNCTLILEGLSNATNGVQSMEVRPLLSILVNVECYLAASQQPISGGRDFLESLVTAVNGYAQEFLSKVNHPEVHKPDSGLVQLQKVNNNRHRLIVHTGSRQFTQRGETPHGTGSPTQIDLTTVQLFDLVEAVDQFFADSQTLPEFSLQLAPTARHASYDRRLAKQAVPATVGVSSLALAAIAFFFVPIPEVGRPPKPKLQSNSAQSTNLPTKDSGVPSSASTPTSVTNLEAAVAAAPKITDSSQIDTLNRKLYHKVNQAWTKRSRVEQDLVYRVGVTSEGAILGYKSVNTEASNAIEQTPLPNLLYNPSGSRAMNQQPLAQFRVVFTEKGVLEVSPWFGRKR